MWQGKLLVILLNGGDKGTQARDIKTAKGLAKEAKDGTESSSL
jgi:putative component of toxin-antitoxin plasmid stabilization module